MRRSSSLPVPPAWTGAALLAGLWLLLGPATPDLAAQLHRDRLFSADGFAVWDNSWYGGHHVPGYSLVFPALGATIGVRLAGALAAVGSAALFERLLGARRSTAACWWFAVGCSADLLVGRLTYALGVTVGLAALAALLADRRTLAVVLAAVCAATSPVAGLFLALAGTGVAAARRRPDDLAVAGAALAVVAVLSAAFPEGGSQGFTTASFLETAAISTGAWLAVGPRSGLRPSVALYLLAVLVCFVVPSPMGGNVSRLGAEFVVPALLVAAPRVRGRRRAALLGLLAAAGVWQWFDPLTQAAKGLADPSAARAYYRPLAAELERRHLLAGRLEVPFTVGHWESVYLAGRFTLARGWERQLDRRLNPLFYTGLPLAPDRYHRWLRANAVRYVALPDAAIDPAGQAEAHLIRATPAFLSPVWHDRHWRLFRVRDTLPIVGRGARVVRVSDTTLRLETTRPGSFVVRVHWTPYWHVRPAGCVTRVGEWTRLRVARPGPVTLSAGFSLDALLDPVPRCGIGPTRRAAGA